MPRIRYILFLALVLFSALPAAAQMAMPDHVCVGATKHYNVDPNPVPGSTYIWKIDGAVQASTVNAIDITWTTEGTYLLEVQEMNAAGCLGPVQSGQVFVTPGKPASVNVAPDLNSVCAGTSVTFTATPTNEGSAPTYQWKLNGTDIAGATGSTYTSSLLVNGDAITVVMTSSETCATNNPAASDPVTMIINPVLPASVVVTASAGEVCEGTSVTFTATPTNGGLTPSYQWKLNGTDIIGETASTYTSSSLVNGDAITVVMTSSATCVSNSPAASDPVTIIVNPGLPVSVMVVASASAVCSGAPVTFTAIPVNAGVPTYQWLVNGANAGTNSDTFVHNYSNGDIVSVLVTSSATCAKGSPAVSGGMVLLVNSSLDASVTITADKTTICTGTQVTFTATPTNGGVPSYQWKKGGVAIDGEIGSTFTSSTLADQDVITVEMTSTEPCVNGSPATSNEIRMTVNSLLEVEVAVAPDANPVVEGTSVKFTASPVNAGTTPVYAWYVNTVVVPGETADTYIYTPADLDEVTASVLSSEPCTSGNPATSNIVVMSVAKLLPVSVTLSAPVTSVCDGVSVTFTATPVNGGTNPVFTWYVNGTEVPGATGATYTYVPANGDEVYVMLLSDLVTVSGNPATSNAVTMSVTQNLPVSVSVSASAGAVCEGTLVTFTATPENASAPVYQWQVNGVNVGTNSTTYAYNYSNGDKVTVLMTSNEPCTTGSPASSNETVLLVNGPMDASVKITSGQTTVCEGTPVTFTAIPTNGGTAPTYIWKKGGTAIVPAETNSTYISTTPANGDIITVEMTSNEPCVIGSPATSNEIVITVNPLLPVSVTVSADANPVFAGTPVTYTAVPVNGGSAPLFAWFVNGVEVPGQTSDTYTYVPSDKDKVSATLLSSETCTSGNPVISNTIDMTVNPLITVGVSINTPVPPVCAGSPVTITALPVNGGSNPVYSWYVNNTLVSGAIGATFTYLPANGDQVYVTLLSDLANVTNNPAASAPVVVTVTSSVETPVFVAGEVSTRCKGAGTETYTATAANSTALTYTLDAASTSGGNTIDASTGAVTYTAVWTDKSVITATATGCSGPAAAIHTVITSGVETASISYDGSPFCITADPVNVHRTGPPGGQYTSAPPGLIIDKDSGTISPSGSLPKTYTITYAANGACGTVTATAEIVVTSGPTAEIEYPGSPFCSSAGPVNVVFLDGVAGGTFSAEPAGLLDINPATGTINPSGSAQGTYLITYRNSGDSECGAGQALATATVSITTAIEGYISYPKEQFCTSDRPILVAIQGTNTGTFSSTPGLDINPNTGTITPGNSTPGTYLITYEIPANPPCRGVTDWKTVTIIEAPNAGTLSYAGPFCTSVTAPQQATLIGDPNGEYSSAPAGLNIDAITGAIIPSASTPGTYVVTYTIPSTDVCLFAIAKTTVVVNPAPTATLSYNGPYCQNVTAGQQPNLTTSATGGTFAGTSGLGIDPVTGAITPSLSSPGKHEVTYTIPASGGCALVTVKADVFITTPPSVTGFFYPGSPFCVLSTESAEPGFSGPKTGEFSATGGLIIDKQTGAIIPANNPVGSYVVTYAIAASGGCDTYEVSTTLIIRNGPTATIAYPGSEFCKSAAPVSVQLVGEQGGEFSAEPSGLNIDASTGLITPGESLPGLYTITYSKTATDECGTTQIKEFASVTITAPPVAAFSYTGTPYCSGGVNPLPAFTGDAVAGTFSSAPAGLIINSQTGEIDLASSIPNTYTITNRIPAAGGCDAVEATFTVSIEKGPVAGFSYLNPSYCSNGPDPIPTLVSGGVAGAYSATPSGLVFISTSTGQVDVSASAHGTYTVTNTVTGTGACEVVLAHSDITVSKLPVATFAYQGTPFCGNGANPLPTFTGEGVAGTFTSEPGLVFADDQTGEIDLSASTPGRYLITNTVTASGCDPVEAYYFVDIKGAPTATISYPGSPFCETLATEQQVAHTGTPGGTYSAEPAGLSINASTGAIKPQASTAGTYTVKYSINNAGECGTFEITTTVTVASSLVAIAYPGTLFCTSSDPLTVLLAGTPGGYYSASPAGLQIDSRNGTITPATSLAGTYTVTYTTPDMGCGKLIATAPVTITKAPVADISYPQASFCLNDAPADPNLTGTTGGTYTSTPLGLSINSTTGKINPAASTPGGPYLITYTIDASGGCATVTATASVTINTAVINITSPVDQTVVLGNDGGFSVQATEPGLSYQWQVDAGSGFTDISNGGVYSGANTDHLVLTAPGMDMSGYRYRVIVSGTCAETVTSGVAVLTVKLYEFIMTVTAVAQNKEYDGNTNATVKLSGNYRPEDQILLDHTSATFDTKDAGTGKTVTVSGITISGPDAYRYAFNSTATTTADITRKPVTVTAKPDQSKVYGADDPVLEYFYAPDLIAGDSFTGVLAREPGENPGEYAILQGTLDPGPNYAVTFVSNPFKITYKTLIYVIVTTGHSKVYGEPDPKLEITSYYPNLEPGDKFTGELSRAPGENVGQYLINRGTLSAGPKYAISLSVSYLMITPKPIMVAAVPDSKVYDGTTASGKQPTITPDLAFNDKSQFIQTFDTREAGTHKRLTPSGRVNDGNDGKNYTVTYIPSDLGTITPKPITASITVADKPYDGTTLATILTSSLNGAIAGDNIIYIGGTAHFDTPDVGTNKPVKATGFSLSGADAPNYTVNDAADARASITALEAGTSLTLNATTFNHYSDQITLTAIVYGGAPKANGPPAAVSATFSIEGLVLTDKSGNSDILLEVTGPDLVAILTVPLLQTTTVGSLATGTHEVIADFNKVNKNYKVVPNPAKATFDFSPGFDLRVFPNPSPGPLIFEISVDVGAGESATLDLYAPNGQLVARLFDGFIAVGEKKTIPYQSHLAQGIYMYRAQIGKEVKVGNVIIIGVY